MTAGAALSLRAAGALTAAFAADLADRAGDLGAAAFAAGVVAAAVADARPGAAGPFAEAVFGVFGVAVFGVAVFGDAALAAGLALAAGVFAGAAPREGRAAVVREFRVLLVVLLVTRVFAALVVVGVVAVLRVLAVLRGFEAVVAPAARERAVVFPAAAPRADVAWRAGVPVPAAARFAEDPARDFWGGFFGVRTRRGDFAELIAGRLPTAPRVVGEERYKIRKSRVFARAASLT